MWTVQLTHVSGSDVTVDLVLPWDSQAQPVVLLDGSPVEAEVTTTFWGTRRVALSGILVPGNGVIRVGVK